MDWPAEPLTLPDGTIVFARGTWKLVGWNHQDGWFLQSNPNSPNPHRELLFIEDAAKEAVVLRDEEGATIHVHKDAPVDTTVFYATINSQLGVPLTA